MNACTISESRAICREKGSWDPERHHEIKKQYQSTARMHIQLLKTLIVYSITHRGSMTAAAMYLVIGLNKVCAAVEVGRPLLPLRPVLELGIHRFNDSRPPAAHSESDSDRPSSKWPCVLSITQFLEAAVQSFEQTQTHLQHTLMLMSSIINNNAVMQFICPMWKMCSLQLHAI